MTTRLPPEPFDDEVLGIVEAWIDDLARNDYESAFDRTEHDAYHRWSPDLMRRVVAGYGLPEPHPTGQVFSVSPRKSTPGVPFHRIVDRSSPTPDEVAEVWYDLPLNGAWSDLTATFSLQRRSDYTVLVLKEIHVF